VYLRQGGEQTGVLFRTTRGYTDVVGQTKGGAVPHQDAALQERLTARRTMAYTHEEKMRRRGHWSQSESVQASYEVMLRLRYAF